MARDNADHRRFASMKRAVARTLKVDSLSSWRLVVTMSDSPATSGSGEIAFTRER